MNVAQKTLERYSLEAEARDFYETLLDDFARELRRRYLDVLKPYKKVELGLAVKGMKTWRGIALLFFGGFSEDAEILLRSLVDVAVDMRFISLDRDARAQRFIDYHAVHRLRWLKQAEARQLMPPEEIVKLKTIVTPVTDEVLKKYPEWKKRLPMGWSKEDTATKVDLIHEPMFYLTFMQGSRHTHPNVTSLGGYFGPGGVSVEARPEAGVPRNARVFLDSCLYLHAVVDHLNGVMNLQLDEQCKRSWSIEENLIRNRYPDVEKDFEEIRRQYSRREQE